MISTKYLLTKYLFKVIIEAKNIDVQKA